MRLSPLMMTCGSSTLVDVLRYRAQDEPLRDAYVFLGNGEDESDRIDYAELDCRARAIALRLQALGTAANRALLLFPPGIEFLAAFLGCLYARIPAVPAYPPRTSGQWRGLPRLQAIFENARPRVVLTVSRLANSVGEALAALSAGDDATVLCVDEIGVSAADEWHAPTITPDDIALIQYTSGSTASPRGVMVSHANLLHNQRMIQQCFGHDRHSKVVSWLPPYHDMGLIGMLLQPLYCGFPCVLMPPAAFLQRPLRWLQAISHYRATTSGAPNFAYDLCVRSIAPKDREGLDLSTWDLAFNGAEPVHHQTLDRFTAAFAPNGFRREAFYPCYGLAEATLLVSGPGKGKAPTELRVDSSALESHQVKLAEHDPHAKVLIGCGSACDQQSIEIVDPATRRRCDQDRVGEIWITGDSVARGYLNQPQATAETFGAALVDSGVGPYMRSGDLGFVHRGELFVTGRIKDLVIIRGINHYPQDIERTAQQSHPSLRLGAGAAFSVSGDDQEQLVIVNEIERTQRHADWEQVFADIRNALAQTHQLNVHRIVLVKPGQMPTTSSGKVQRQACRQQLAGDTLEIVAQWIQTPPLAEQPTAQSTIDSGELEDQEMEMDDREMVLAWLTRHCAKALNCAPDEIDITEPMGRYGLDSSIAAGLSGLLADAIGRDLPATLFWDYPTIDTLAAFLMSECGVCRQTLRAKQV